MNLRKLTQMYMGWCPGVESAARFIPDRDISNRTMFVSASVLLITVGAVAFFKTRVHSSWTPEIEEGPIGELPVEWVNSYDASEDDRGEYVLVTRDDGYLVVGYNSTLSVGDSVCLLKVSSNGTLQWSRTYGDTGWDAGRYAVESEDGYVITGYANEDLLLMKVDDQGETLWSRTYGKGSGFAVEETSDGGYAVAGKSDVDVFLIKTDRDGELSWSKTYGGVGEHQGRALQVTSDGGYLIGGISRGDPGSSNWDWYVLKTDSLGEVTWSKTLGGPKGDWLYSVLETPDDGVLAVGYRVEVGPGGGAGGSSTWAVKLDKDGEAVWSKTYSGPCGFDVRRASNGGYVILSKIHGDLLLMKIDEEGRLEWSKSYGESFKEEGSCLQVTEDGGYIISGYHEVSVLDRNILLLKVPQLEDDESS